MQVIETEAEVTEDGNLTVHVHLPQPTNPGRCRVVVVIGEKEDHEGKPKPLNLPLLPIKNWPADLSLRREDMYDDWGR